MTDKNMFKYLGDDFLALRDTLNKLNRSEQIIMNMNYDGIFFEQKEFMYMIESDKELIRQAEFMMGVNRVLKSNKKKYGKILSGEDPKYPEPRKIQIIMNNRKPQTIPKPKTPHYLQ